MANKGSFVILFDSIHLGCSLKSHFRPNMVNQAKKQFEEFVASEDNHLKNLEWVAGPTPWPGSILAGTCDRLMAGDLLRFFGGSIPDGVKVFVVDSLTGDIWTEVK